jgi:hypothetical protein
VKWGDFIELDFLSERVYDLQKLNRVPVIFRQALLQ